MSNKALAGGNEAVRTDESTDFGVIISALEVVEPCFCVVDVAAVAEGVEGGYGAGGGACGIAPGIVGIGGYSSAGGADDFDHIALEVGYIVVNCAVVGDGGGGTGGIVGEIEGIATLRQLHQLTAVIHILPGGGCTVVGVAA